MIAIQFIFSTNLNILFLFFLFPTIIINYSLLLDFEVIELLVHFFTQLINCFQHKIKKLANIALVIFASPKDLELVETFLNLPRSQRFVINFMPIFIIDLQFTLIIIHSCDMI